MDKLIALYRANKEQIKWAFVGVAVVLLAYYSYQALIAFVAVFLGGTIQPGKAEREKSRDRIREVAKAQQDHDEAVEAIRKDAVVKQNAAEKKASDDVDDFIDGGW